MGSLESETQASAGQLTGDGRLGDEPAPAAEPRHAHLRVVLDVFEAFLNTDNVLVFANAAVDCILCLLKHVRGPTELQDNNSSLQDQEQVVPLDTLGGTQLDLCRAALRYISRCHAILASMHGMHSCPVFHAAHRIQLNTAPLTVDPAPDDESAPPEEPPTSPADGPPVTYERLAVQGPFTALEQLDNASGILRVWYLLLEGLAGATATCPRRHQPQTMETLFTLLRSLANRPGAEFGIYCVNHLLLPMVQGWLRRTGRRHRGWDAFATNFKQCCGLATDLVVFYHKTLPADASERQRAGAQLMMRQLLLVMIECVCQPHEVISRLGCACIRYRPSDNSTLHATLSPTLPLSRCSRQSAASSLPTACRSVARSGRPLVHLIRAWSVVCHHLMEAACHKELAVSKKAVCCIHDTVNAMLSSHSELPHFHVNEALFKPLETLLCLELCDADVQDQRAAPAQ
ncbi:brefeldin A-inhibited guanine nucleotide-exchange protein 3-like [Pollicipes pollicipes]|uniref:brefeldin A-inhibited guanine nucleotide-exchange protein 3-like n=1 Tax=Pollicipes pollicipes TaxID=41117 RepID=UPI001885287B|nr:brefeldin A-inhibited guanine nucleotide-exchange protein 3-like [Pollicipes pollicipes]